MKEVMPGGGGYVSKAMNIMVVWEVCQNNIQQIVQQAMSKQDASLLHVSKKAPRSTSHISLPNVQSALATKRGNIVVSEKNAKGNPT